MIFSILTIFPEIFSSYFNESIINRAQEKKIIKIKTINIRDYADDKHKTVDAPPYGGGAGMVMKPEPIYKALKNHLNSFPSREGLGVCKKKRIILLTPKGKIFNQKEAQRLAKYDELIFICGRYEGIDARIEKFTDEKISIGNYVITGGELGAMIIIDAITRLLPNVLGNKESTKDESHSVENVLEYHQYTRPEIFEANGKKLKVPKVLLSGNHKEIEEWRKKMKKIISSK
ncbi:MAG: tRNA (guanosine(37)-N1)-methyltransferase TrmD [bacterium]